MWGKIRWVARLSAASIAALAAAGTEAAKPIYFHRTAVERATFVADISLCNELAGGVRAPRYSVYSPNAVSMAASSFFAGFFGAREKRGIMDNVLRTCMADKGYRRVEATPALLKSLRGLPETERLERLFALAAAPTPEGKVLPR